MQCTTLHIELRVYQIADARWDWTYKNVNAKSFRRIAYAHPHRDDMNRMGDEVSVFCYEMTQDKRWVKTGSGIGIICENTHAVQICYK